MCLMGGRGHRFMTKALRISFFCPFPYLDDVNGFGTIFFFFTCLVFLSETIFCRKLVVKLKLGLSTAKLAMTKRKQESEVWADDGELR